MTFFLQYNRDNLNLSRVQFHYEFRCAIINNSGETLTMERYGSHMRTVEPLIEGYIE